MSAPAASELPPFGVAADRADHPLEAVPPQLASGDVLASGSGIANTTALETVQPQAMPESRSGVGVDHPPTFRGDAVQP